MNKKDPKWLNDYLGFPPQGHLASRPAAQINPNELANMISDQFSELLAEIFSEGAPLDQITKTAFLILYNTLCDTGTFIMQARNGMNKNKADIASEKIAANITNTVIDSFKEAYGFAMIDE